MNWRRGRVCVAVAATAASLLGLMGSPVPATAEPASVPLNDCVDSDNGDPIVTGLGIAPSKIDLSDGPRKVTVTVSAEDTGGPGPATGIRGGSVILSEDPSGSGGVSHALTQISATQWQARITFVPGGGHHGTLRPLIALADHSRFGGFYLTSDELAAQGFRASLTVRDAAPFDSVRPVMTALHLSRSTVDARDGDKRIKVRARLLDSLSGVGRVSVGTELGGTRLHLASGSRRDGVWRGHLTVSRWAGSQTAHLYVKMFDRVGTRRIYGRKALRDNGFPTGFQVRALRDLHGPVPQALSTLPPTIDARTSDATIPVRIRVSDARSGTAAVAAYVTDGSFRSPPARLRLASGTVHDGVWEGAVVVPHCTANTASYQLAVRTQDVRGASRDRPVTERSMAVTAGDHALALPINGSALSWQTPATFQVTFSEDVVGISTASALVRRTVFRPTYKTSTIEGSWTCTDAAGQPTDCVIGPVRAATVTITETPLAGAAYSATLNPEHVLDVRDYAGNAPRRTEVFFGQNGTVS